MATRMFDRRPAAALADPRDRVAAIVARHGDLLTRVARSLLALRRRRPGRRPARARDLHAARRVARPGDRARLAEGRREARGAGGPPEPSGGRERGGRPRRGARGRPALGRGAARVGRAGRAVRRGHAAPEARRGAGADAQGRGPLVRRDRRAASDGPIRRSTGALRRGAAGSCASTPSSRRARSASGSPRRSWRWPRARRRARRSWSSGRTCATARRAERRSAISTPRGCGASPRGCRWAR